MKYWLSTLFILGLLFEGMLLVQKTSYYNTVANYFEAFMSIYFSTTIIFFIFANSFYVLILLLGFINARKQFLTKLTHITKHLSPLKTLKPISIIVPCYNEQESITASLYSMLRINYPNFEVIVCNDGSTDSSLDILIDEFKLKKADAISANALNSNPIRDVYHSIRHKNLIVIDKKNGGKADALNAAINYSQFPLICCVDADSIIEQNGLINVSLPFLEGQNIIATGGTILLANTEEINHTKKNNTAIDTRINPTWLGIIQSTEYLRAFLVGRLGWDYLKCDSIISGAFGLFKKSLVIEVGGYAKKTIGEDMELLLRMQSHCLKNNIPYEVKLLPTPVCWTEAPSDLKTLGNQRVRWTQGLAESLWLHRDMLFKPWAGRLGLIGMPYYLFYELFSAPVEIIGYALIFIGIGLNIFSVKIIAAFLAATILFGCVLNLGAIIIDQFTFRKYRRISDLLKLILGAFIEHFGYRQIHLFWRVKGIYRWLVGKQQWGEMKRKGFNQIK